MARKNDLLPAVRVTQELGELARRRAEQAGKSITDWLRQIVAAAAEDGERRGADSDAQA